MSRLTRAVTDIIPYRDRGAVQQMPSNNIQQLQSSNGAVNMLPLSPQFNTLITRDPTAQKFALEGYSKNSIVFDVVSIRAEAVQQAPLITFRKTDEKEKLLTSNIQALIDRPNPVLDFLQLLMYLEIYMSIGGDAYLHKVRDGYGIVRELYPYHASQMLPIVGDNRWITGYRYDNGAGFVKIIPPSDIIHFRWAAIDFFRPYKSLPPLLALAKEVDIDNQSAEIEVALLMNGMVPSFVMISDPTLEPMTDTEIKEQQERIKTRQGGKNRGAPMVLNPGIKVEKLGFSPKDMSNSLMRLIPETRISGVFGVPIEITGLWAGLEYSTYANKETARQFFLQDKILPHWRRIGRTFTHGLSGEYFPDGINGNDVICTFDTSHVPGLQETRDKIEGRIMEQWKSGLIKRGYALQLLGLDPCATDDDVYLYLAEPDVVATTKQTLETAGT